MLYSIIVDCRNIEPFILYVDGKPDSRKVKRLVKKELLSMVNVKVERYLKDKIDLIDCLDIHNEQ
jgi:hypothetical protein